VRRCSVTQCFKYRRSFLPIMSVFVQRSVSRYWLMYHPKVFQYFCESMPTVNCLVCWRSAFPCTIRLM
jgi:hypothetical protein